MTLSQPIVLSTIHWQWRFAMQQLQHDPAAIIVAPAEIVG